MTGTTITMQADNLVLPFAARALGVRGRIVRLGDVTNQIVHRHDYPAAVSALLCEAIALTAMLGAMSANVAGKRLAVRKVFAVGAAAAGETCGRDRADERHQTAGSDEKVHKLLQSSAGHLPG